MTFALLVWIGSWHIPNQKEETGEVYEKSQPLVLYTNKVWSDQSRLPYAYHELPFVCNDRRGTYKQVEGQNQVHSSDRLAFPGKRKLSLANLLQGDRQWASSYKIEALVDQECQELCHLSLGRKQQLAAHQLVKTNYVVDWELDGLPGATAFISMDKGNRQKYYASGFPLGAVDVETNLTTLNNHMSIVIRYRYADLDEDNENTEHIPLDPTASTEEPTTVEQRTHESRETLSPRLQEDTENANSQTDTNDPQNDSPYRHHRHHYNQKRTTDKRQRIRIVGFEVFPRSIDTASLAETGLSMCAKASNTRTRLSQRDQENGKSSNSTLYSVPVPGMVGSGSGNVAPFYLNVSTNAPQKTLYYTYSVSWKEESDPRVTWQSRWQRYFVWQYKELLEKQEREQMYTVQWSRLTRSALTLLLIVGLIALQVKRIVIALRKYSPSGSVTLKSPVWTNRVFLQRAMMIFDASQEDTLFSSSRVLIAVMGNGIQLALSVILFLILAYLAQNKSSLSANQVLIGLGLGGIGAGYCVGCIFSKLRLQGNWNFCLCLIGAGLFVPGILLCVLLTFNVIVWMQSSSLALPAPTIILFFVLWGTNAVLVFIGGIWARSRQRRSGSKPGKRPLSSSMSGLSQTAIQKDDTMKVGSQGSTSIPHTSINSASSSPYMRPRSDAEGPGLLVTTFETLMWGLVPFLLMNVFINMDITMSISLHHPGLRLSAGAQEGWLRTRVHEVWTSPLVYGIASLVHCASIVQVAVYATLIGLKRDQTRWWWRSFLVGSASTWWLILSNVYSHAADSQTQGLASTVVYFIQNLMVWICYGTVTGTIGFLAALAFVSKMYNTVKRD